jgi:hypothetical protein
MKGNARKLLGATTVLLFMTHAVILPSSGAAQKPVDGKNKGAVCLGIYAPKMIQDHELQRVYLTVGESDKIFFDQQPGTIVADNLDLHKTYVVRVFYDSKQVNSWKLRFDRLGANLVTIWRSAGYWKMDPNPSGECSWPGKSH